MLLWFELFEMSELLVFVIRNIYFEFVELLNWISGSFCTYILISLSLFSEQPSCCWVIILDCGQKKNMRFQFAESLQDFLRPKWKCEIAQRTLVCRISNQSEKSKYRTHYIVDTKIIWYGFTGHTLRTIENQTIRNSSLHFLDEDGAKLELGIQWTQTKRKCVYRFSVAIC